jgi:septal ring factor EnvC (AmiA/AmiB activator)
MQLTLPPGLTPETVATLVVGAAALANAVARYLTKKSEDSRPPRADDKTTQGYIDKLMKDVEYFRDRVDKLDRDLRPCIEESAEIEVKLHKAELDLKEMIRKLDEANNKVVELTMINEDLRGRIEVLERANQKQVDRERRGSESVE